jgi:cytochrome c oxidase subunit 2
MNQPPVGRPRPSASIIIAAAIIVILGVVVVVSALTVFQPLDPITKEAKHTHLLYQPVLAISFAIYFAVTAGIIWAIFRFKRKSNDEMPVQVHGSSVVEIGGVFFSVIILVGLFIPSLILVLDLKTPPASGDIDLNVEAIGHQWWWEFNYPDNGIHVQSTPPDYEKLTPPALVVPVGKTISIKVRSTDVVHSFSVPRTLYKLQAIPGNVNQMHFKTEKVGTFTGQCFQFCGLRHADMRFVLQVMSESDYQKWLSDQKKAQSAPASSSDLATNVTTSNLITASNKSE